MAAPAALTPQQKMDIAVRNNAIAREMIARRAVERISELPSQSVAASTSNNVLNFNPQMYGILRGFFVFITGTATNTGASTDATLTTNGAANLLKWCTMTDLNNYQRIYTSGRHLWQIAGAKGNRMFNAVNTLTSYPYTVGSVLTANSMGAAPATIPHTSSNTGTVSAWYYIPATYSRSDLRGGIFLNVVNATMQLQLEINPTPFVASGDALNAIYSGNTGTLTNVSVRVWQHAWDQLPTDPRTGLAILPEMDLSQFYQLQESTLPNVVASSDFLIAYGNQRTFYSTFATYNQNGTRNAGTDINYWAIRNASTYDLIKYTPYLNGVINRTYVGDDWPAGTYYFDHRLRPINTIQWGNMALVLNASSAAASSSVTVGWEFFSDQATILQSGSLASAGI